jgi:hypothetical protein
MEWCEDLFKLRLAITSLCEKLLGLAHGGPAKGQGLTDEIHEKE